MPERNRPVTNGGHGQQIRGNQLSPRAFLFTSIDAIAGQVRFKIAGPGQVYDERRRSCAGEHGGDEVLRRGRREDRKSTRLNSSHVAISYAVFCLKKKT